MKKAAFFDRSHNSDWALRDYSPQEIEKLNLYMELAGVAAGHKVLEPGCGTGRFTAMLSKQVGPEGEVVAVDISTKMTEGCLRRVRNLSNVRILNAPVEWISFPEHYFDVIFCLCVFPHFGNKQEVLRYLHHCMHPAGSLVVAHLEGSRTLNRMHERAGGAVKHDRIPPFRKMERIFLEVGLSISNFWDNDSGYFLLAHAKREDKS